MEDMSGIMIDEVAVHAVEDNHTSPVAIEEKTTIYQGGDIAGRAPEEVLQAYDAMLVEDAKQATPNIGQ